MEIPMESEDTIDVEDSNDSGDSDRSDETVDTVEVKKSKDGVYSQIPMPFNMDIIAKTPIATVEEADEPSETSEDGNHGLHGIHGMRGIDTARFPICSLQTHNLMESDPDPNHLSAAPVLLESESTPPIRPRSINSHQRLVGSLRLSITASPAISPGQSPGGSPGHFPARSPGRTPNPFDTPTPRYGESRHLSLSPGLGATLCVSPNAPDTDRCSHLSQLSQPSVRSVHSEADMEAMEQTLYSYINSTGHRSSIDTGDHNHGTHHYVKSKSDVSSTTEPNRGRRGKLSTSHGRKLTDLLSGRSITGTERREYSPVGRGRGDKHIRAISRLKSNTNTNTTNNSVSTDRGDRMHSGDTANGSRKCSFLQTVFGHKRSDRRQNHQRIDSKRSAFSSMRELSENLSSKMRRKERDRDCRSFSSRINFGVVQDLIDIQLHSDITSLVLPLTYEFIPIPESFYDATVEEAAKHIFKHFIASSAPYAINISYETRSYLRGLLSDQTPSSSGGGARESGGLSKMSDLTKLFLFDSAFCEIYQTVASDSFLRFKSSLKFREWLKEGHLTRVPKVRQRRHHKEDSQCSFNASFVDFNTTLHHEKRKEDEIIRKGVVLKSLPSGQTVDAVKPPRNE